MKMTDASESSETAMGQAQERNQDKKIKIKDFCWLDDDEALKILERTLREGTQA